MLDTQNDHLGVAMSEARELFPYIVFGAGGPMMDFSPRLMPADAVVEPTKAQEVPIDDPKESVTDLVKAKKEKEEPPVIVAEVVLPMPPL